MSESVDTGSTGVNVVAQTRRAEDGGGPVEPAAAGRGWSSWRQTTVPGVWGALAFACLSFTPSLLPRSGLIQGIVAGVTAAIGYGVGVLLAVVWRAFADRDTRPARPSTWRISWIAGGLLLALFFALGQYWQHEIRGLMGVTDYNIALVVLSPVVALLVFALLVALGRGLRGLYRRLARLIRRWIGPRAANALGWIAVVGLTYLVVSGILLDGLVNAANETFGVRDTTTAEGVQQPTTPLRSGGHGLAGRLGHPRVAGAHVRGHGPDGRRHHGHRHRPRRNRSGRTQGSLRRRTRSSGRRSPSTTSSTRAGSSAPTCWWSDDRQRLDRPGSPSTPSST